MMSLRLTFPTTSSIPTIPTTRSGSRITREWDQTPNGWRNTPRTNLRKFRVAAWNQYTCEPVTVREMPCFSTDCAIIQLMQGLIVSAHLG